MTAKSWALPALVMAVLTFGQPARAVVFDRPGGTGNVTSNDVVNIINNVAPTNSGITAAQAGSQIKGTNDAYVVYRNSGVSKDLTTINTFTVTNGTYINFFLANGAYLRTNTIAPFDWESHNTNGTITWGTNTITKVTVDIFGNVTGTSFTGDGSGLTGISGGGSAFPLAAAGNANGFSITNLWQSSWHTNSGGTHLIWKATPGPQIGSTLLGGAVSALDFSATGDLLYAPVGANTFVAHGNGFGGNYEGAFVAVDSGGASYSRMSPGSIETPLLEVGTNALSATNTVQVDTFAFPKAFQIGTNGNTYIGGSLFGATGGFSTLTATTAWLTNVVIPTNAFVGTIVDFNQGYGATNLGGNITFSDVANVTAGAVNTAQRRLFSGGSDRVVAFPVGWHTNYGFIGVVSNGWQMDLLITVTGARTNVAQILYP